MTPVKMIKFVKTKCHIQLILNAYGYISFNGRNPKCTKLVEPEHQSLKLRSALNKTHKNERTTEERKKTHLIDTTQ